MGKIDYRTLRENVAEEIRMKIFKQELAPGTRIIEQELSDEFGVSRAPIREALRQLEQDGLVEYVRNSGCSVKKISIQDVYEVYLLRSLYETLAVKMCEGKFSEESIGRMKEALEMMNASCESEEQDYLLITGDEMFHRAIIEMSGLPRLIKAWKDLGYGNIISCYGNDMGEKASSKRSYPIHKRLLEICETGDVKNICEAISEHYMTTIRRRVKEVGMSEDNFKYLNI